MLNKKLLGSVSAPPAEYVEDVFSTYLYSGNSSTQTITNDIDLSGDGGLTWIKCRSFAYGHLLYDTARGASSGYLSSKDTNAQSGSTYGLTSFNSNGFSLNSDIGANESAQTYCSWTFRKAKKFFDVVTATKSGGVVTFNHNLGVAPGMVFVKCTNTTENWLVYHRSTGVNKYLFLNSTAAADTYNDVFSSSSTQFSLNSADGTNYVAYLFAHDAGGFGTAGTDNIITCGSFTSNSNGDNVSVSLGYEPQWVLVKNTTSTGDWFIEDNMRAFNLTARALLRPNLSDAENTGTTVYYSPTSTGFTAGQLSPSSTYIYMAIRRPMKVPTTGTNVFSPVARTGTSGVSTSITTVGFSPDFIIQKPRPNSNTGFSVDRLRGRGVYLSQSSTNAENATASLSTQDLVSFDMNGFTVGTAENTNMNSGTATEIYWNFRRASGFFDIVCYTGTGSSAQIPHNLGAIPELCISKRRAATSSWFIDRPLNTTSYNQGAFDSAAFYDNWLPDGMAATSTTIRPPNSSNGQTMVMYLFATLAGVSKVGSYTGTGTTQTINCGFTSGARFVLIKRLDSTGDWFVWDTARGIVSGNDPYLLLNTTAAEVTNTDYIDPVSSGFEISSTAPAAINANGGSFLFLAIA